ncbi:MAG TPA: apolipoprotein N-acyltransferase, partial [Luteolibacter sp.]|nr:apolipoprotein N-acyltransferase [Luteolibacter sp.]
LMLVWIGGLQVISEARLKREQTLRSFQPAFVGLGLVLAVLGYGWLRIHQEKSRETTPLRALLVQQNIPQDAARYLWDPAEIHMAYENETLAALEKAKAAGTFPDWVIWPESALTGRFLRTDDGKWGTWRENAESIGNVREGGDFTLMFGAVELQAETHGDELVMKEDGDTWNSLVVMSPEDDLQTFRKHHLVIFGETIPFVDSIPLLKEIYKQQAGVEYGGSFSPGKSFQPLSAQAGGKTIEIIPTVCFEDTVPRLVRKFLRPGPQVIVNVTNDGWFKESIAAAQHFANAKFRAIELRRPMIRCANTGVTAAITPTGEAKILTGPDGSHFTRGSMLADVAIPLKPGFSLYGMIGDWGIIATGVAGFAGCLIARKRGKNRPDPAAGV